MSDSALRAFVGRPVPAVHAGDVKRVSSFLSEQPADPRAQGQASFNLKLLAGLCDKNADVLAVWFRATLVEALRKEGRLERWREVNSLRDKVFDVAAAFPLPEGPANADLGAFVAALE